MAFTVEDGTNVVGANAYITVAFFKSYHKDRGATISSGTGDIEKAIIRATDFMVGRWKFVGIQQDAAQGLHWPATGARYYDGRLALLVPTEVQQSCADYSLLELNTAGSLTVAPTYDDSNSSVTKRMDKVGPIEELREFGSAGAVRTWRKFPGPDQRLTKVGLVITGNRLLRS